MYRPSFDNADNVLTWFEDTHWLTIDDNILQLEHKIGFQLNNAEHNNDRE